MSMQWWGFLASIFAGLSILGRIAEGALIKSADIAVMRAMSVFADMEIFGLFKVPIINPTFFTTGLKHLVTWDYAFFGGNAAILAYLMSAISAAATFGLFLVIIGMVGQFFTRR